MKRKIYIGRTLKILSLLLCLLVSLGFLQSYFFRANDTILHKVDSFFLEEPNSLDIVFIGSSELTTGFFPGYAYQKHGLTSGQIAMNRNPITLYKPQLIDALNTQSPQMIVIELSGCFFETNEDLYKEPQLRPYLTPMPFSKNKLETINSLVPKEDRLSYIFPFIKYHGCWSDWETCVSQCRQKITTQIVGYEYLRGISTTTARDITPKSPEFKEDGSVKKITSDAERYLMELLQYLKSENIENVLFVRYPFKRADDSLYGIEYVTTQYQMSNYVSKIVEDAGFDYLDLGNKVDEIGLDYISDFHNGFHMNVYGAQKTTDYLCQVLTERYGVKNRSLPQKQKEEWELSAQYTETLMDYCKECIENGEEYSFYQSPELIDLLEKRMKQP